MLNTCLYTQLKTGMTGMYASAPNTDSDKTKVNMNLFVWRNVLILSIFPI